MNAFGFGPAAGGFSAPIPEGAPMLTATLLRDGARKVINASNELPVGTKDLKKIEDVIAIANTWIEGVTQFPLTAFNADIAWTRRDWVDHSIAGWQELVEPLAQAMAAALVKVMGQISPDIPEEIRASFNMEAMLPVMRGFMGTMIASQLGQSVGTLATKVTGAGDIALPVFKKGGAHLIPQNIAEWSEGLEIPEQEILLYLALRETAANRLFTHTPWLPQYLRDLMSEYGKGITVDISAMQSQAESALSSGELDINNPESITLAINNGMFQPEQSDAQRRALAKLEMALALIEGWIEHLTALAGSERIPSFNALVEMHRRSRITNAPTQQLFASLLGLEISPRKMRECQAFWNKVYEIGGEEVRDHRWEDSALLPQESDLEDPAAFIASTTVPDDLSGLL